jgi:hypothetical protein
MSESHFHPIKLPLTLAQFRRLPRNAAYKYEYLGDEAWLTPRPRWFHALLTLEPVAVPQPVDAGEDVLLRPLRPDDWDDLPGLFAASFRTVQPYGSLDEEGRRQAAREAIEQTRSGGDGPLIERACFVAVTEGGKHRCGAILVTLM